ncbi:hypothetical protein [Oceanobacillus timonensis]|uniref:hypothetical protein n=1 Tax=Oceanobacillus timonensis TaxID=1926285 RepID=UPI0009BB1624|nr:hypothetical protein [Oceanobacillus timonensis]
MNALQIFLFLFIISLPLVPFLSVLVSRIARKLKTEVNTNDDIKPNGEHDKPVMKTNPYKHIISISTIIFILIAISVPEKIIEMIEFLLGLFVN